MRTLNLANPSRGEIWLVNLDPTKGREQAGTRPCLVLSVDKFNHGPAELLVVLPITSKNKRIPSHVTIPKGEGGTKEESYIKCEEVRCISRDRLISCWGSVNYAILQQVEYHVRFLLGL